MWNRWRRWCISTSSGNICKVLMLRLVVVQMRARLGKVISGGSFLSFVEIPGMMVQSNNSWRIKNGIWFSNKSKSLKIRGNFHISSNITSFSSFKANLMKSSRMKQPSSTKVSAKSSDSSPNFSEYIFRTWGSEARTILSHFCSLLSWWRLMRLRRNSHLYPPLAIVEFSCYGRDQWRWPLGHKSLHQLLGLMELHILCMVQVCSFSNDLSSNDLSFDLLHVCNHIINLYFFYFVWCSNFCHLSLFMSLCVILNCMSRVSWYIGVEHAILQSCDHWLGTGGI